jgi:uncharacterized protein YbaP (TraB family)
MVMLVCSLGLAVAGGCKQDEKDSAAKANCPPSAASLVPKGGWASAPPQTQDHGFLWRIEKDAHTSWLYGTAHIAKTEWMRPGPKVREALQQSEVIALEINPQEEAQGENVAGNFSTADANSLSLNDVQRERLSRLLRAACISSDFSREIEKMRPSLQIALLNFFSTQIDGLYAEFGSEHYLISYAHDAQKSVVGLETVAERAMLIAGDGREKNLPAQIDAALYQLESGKNRKIAAITADAWARGDLEKLEHYEEWCDCLKTSEEQTVHWRLTVGRQPTMAARIEHLHDDGKRVFAAVGAMHMVGDRGLPSLLIERGFQVTRVPLTERP